MRNIQVPFQYLGSAILFCIFLSLVILSKGQLGPRSQLCLLLLPQQLLLQDELSVNLGSACHGCATASDDLVEALLRSVPHTTRILQACKVICGRRAVVHCWKVKRSKGQRLRAVYQSRW